MNGGGLMIWPAPAKLNLMLRIIGRRPDGYHLLQTVFQFLDLSDTLRFQCREDGEIRHLDPIPGVTLETDLVVRAARLLQLASGTALGVEIGLDKRLPMGGGLGGGSSDAATTLVALNQLWEIGFSRERLSRLGLALGADVPVFINGGAAWAEGVGEQLRPLVLPTPWYLLLLPDCRVSTAEIFGDPDLTRDSPRIKIRDFLSGRRGNDCLSVVCRRYPQVADAMEWLGRFGQPRLTGTGACVFAAFEKEAPARQILEQVPERFQAWVVRGLNRSPLLEAMEEATISWGVAKR